MNTKDLDRCFEAIGAQPFHRALFNLCIGYQPNLAVDIGTGTGNSAIALALGGAKKVTTIDMKRHAWNGVQLDLAESAIKRITKERGNFQNMLPIPPSRRGRVMLFYDIHDFEHDQEKRSSEHFVEHWLPHFESALVAVHDMMPVPPGWLPPKGWLDPPKSSVGDLHTGQRFAGFGECEYFVEYLNLHNADLHIARGTKSLVYFYIRDGVPE